MRSLEKRKRDKAVREEQNLKTRAAKAREKQAALWQIERWKDGKMISTEQVTEMEEPEDEEGDWDEDEPARKLRQGPQLLTTALHRSSALHLLNAGVGPALHHTWLRLGLAGDYPWLLEHMQPMHVAPGSY